MHILLVLIEFAVVLGIMVLVHEFGHFLAAKLCGVRVEVFSIGFPPRLFGFRHGETDYRISLIPLGGYVKFAGDNPSGETSDGLAAAGEFNAQPRWKRIVIAFAGPCANFLLSFFLLTLVAKNHHEVDQYLNGPAVVDYVPANTPAARDGIAPGDTIIQFNGIRQPTWNQILEECALNLNRSLPVTFTHNGQTLTRPLSINIGGDGAEFDPNSMFAIGLIPKMQAGPVDVFTVSSGMPAARAGLQAGDQLVRIDGFEPHSVYAVRAYLNDHSGAPAMLLVFRHGQPVTLTATPERVDEASGQPQYQLGFTNREPPVDVVHLPLGAAMKQSLQDNRDDSTLILRVLKGMFTRHVSVRSLSGPVGIAQQIDLAAQLGIWTVFRLMSTISLNLGIFNLLPIPILDGGMILFLLIESVMRRDVSMQLKERVYQVAFVCIIVFAVFVLFNDISKLPHFTKP